MTIRVLVPQRKRQELFQTLQALTESTRKKKGCLNSRVYTEMENGDSVYLVEEWLTQAHLDKHLLTQEFAVLFGALKMLHCEPTLEVKLLSPTGGIETIEAVRKQQGEN